MPKIQVHIVRHGETAENRSRILQGQLDTDLNQQGIHQASLVAEALRDVPFRVAFTSDLKRAKLTARSILKFHPNVELQECEALRERFMGASQGAQGTRDVIAALAKDKTAETREQMANRALDWWFKAIVGLLAVEPESDSPRTDDNPENDSEDSITNVLVVSHGGLIITLLHNLIREGYAISNRYRLPLASCLNTSISTLELGPGAESPAVLTKHGNISHLLKHNAGKIVQQNVDEAKVDPVDVATS